jgi:hypothetical protein
VDNLTIQELMRPVEQFPRISDQANFHEAVLALEKAQEEFRAGKAPQRILLVEDKKGTIVGKLSPMDLVRGLEPKYDKIDSLGDDIRFGLPQVVRSMKEDYRLWQEPLGELCRKAGNIKVENMLNIPGKTQSVKLTERLDNAFHLFVTARHDSLYVMDGDDIVGLLRFSDVYAAICKVVKACETAG